MFIEPRQIKVIVIKGKKRKMHRAICEDCGKKFWAYPFNKGKFCKRGGRTGCKSIAGKTLEIMGRYQTGESCYALAEEYDCDPSHIRHLARRYSLRRHPGMVVEREVYRWLLKRGITVKHMPGDHPFDLLLDDGTRIDVKSANEGDGYYRFQLYDLKSRSSIKNIKEVFDELYLVFLDLPRRPVYRLPTADVDARTMLTIPSTFNTKYPIKRIGFLGGPK